MPATDPELAAAAVAAHGLLTSVSIIRTAAATLQRAWGELPEGERGDLLELIDTQAGFVADVLGDIVRGLPAEALRAVDDLRRGR